MKIFSSFALILMILGYESSFGQKRSFITPDFIVAQYAGSIGYLSAGAGYDIFKTRGRMSFHFGSVPENQGGLLNIFAGKLFYEPWKIAVSEKVEINLFDPGLMISYHMGDGDFKSNVPDYTKSYNYYWWHTSLRIHIAAESSVSIRFDDNRFFKKITLYAEANSNDLYMVSFFKNAATVPPHDLIKIGLGTRLGF